MGAACWICHLLLFSFSFLIVLLYVVGGVVVVCVCVLHIVVDCWVLGGGLFIFSIRQTIEFEQRF